MKDIFNRDNYIIEAEDDVETDFSSTLNDKPESSDEPDTDDTDTEAPDTDFGSTSEDEPDTDTDFSSTTTTSNEDDDDNEDQPEEGDVVDDTSEEEELEPEEEEEPVDIRALEKELYSDFSDSDIEIRNEELKECYVKVYSFIKEYIDKITDVKKSNINLKVLEYCEDKLIELKLLTYKYITVNFTTNTYIQNQIRYKQILFTLSKITDILTKISDENEINRTSDVD